MNRRQGKRADHDGQYDHFSNSISNNNNDDYNEIFPAYSARSEEDMSAIVSALSQVIGNSNTNQQTTTQSPNIPFMTSYHQQQPIVTSNPSASTHHQQEQGTLIH